uniref:Thg1 C-terminal domain-containing protein n=1 Tax=Aegilops tauschii subsp. strangulata TaxID=200361 RepID=A0A452XQZ9_AEGTS
MINVLIMGNAAARACHKKYARLNLSSCSCFTFFYIMNWKANKELVQPPQFEAEVLCYPKPEIVCDYLSWRQAELCRDEYLLMPVSPFLNETSSNLLLDASEVRKRQIWSS